MLNCNENFKIFLKTLTVDSSSQKVLFESIAAWILNGKKINVDLIGTDDQIRVIKDVMLETKKFHDELFSKAATLESINEKLNLKHFAANSFFNLFKIKWHF